MEGPVPGVPRTDITHRIFGIRHHGPGSARSLASALEAMEPDIVLIEGPPEGEDALKLALHSDMKPPVALLIHDVDDPKLALFYPFAVFSPEWQAMQYGLKRGIPVRFTDLPAANMLAIREDDEDHRSPQEVPKPSDDPLYYLAEAAGFSDGERWWEYMVEHRRDSEGVFSAIMEAMSEVRTALPPPEDDREPKREAHMRQCIRTAQGEGFNRIAVVCGAWHAPALIDLPPPSNDTALLKGLPKTKVQATWVPWTYDRLSYYSGYGAGIESPGWYHHLWTTKNEPAIGWMTKVAQLLREEDLDASSAQVIDAIRLAESLAALRDRPLPGLPEMNEAAQSAMCFGNEAPMNLIARRLIIGDVLGRVPEETPMVPLQQDLVREQKRLRFPAEASQKVLDLDLRKPNDLDRSKLLHRLNILGVPWGINDQVRGKKGTFHEVWQVQWRPEFAVSIIEAARWGNTVMDAASAFACDLADRARELSDLTALLDSALPADIPDAVEHIMTRLQAQSAVASDVGHLMDALPPLANVMRYGNVRKTDLGMVTQVMDGLVARICIGLPGACSSLNDEAAAEMLERILSVNGAISMLANDEYTTGWHGALAGMADQQGLHGLISGRCCRILLDGGRFSDEDAQKRLSYALSPAGDASQSAAWVEGFLTGSGLLLLHTDALWRILDDWVSELNGDVFSELLPILRRTFATFSAPERRQMGERAKREQGGASALTGEASGGRFNRERARSVLPLAAKLLGLEVTSDV